MYMPKLFKMNKESPPQSSSDMLMMSNMDILTSMAPSLPPFYIFYFCFLVLRYVTFMLRYNQLIASDPWDWRLRASGTKRRYYYIEEKGRGADCPGRLIRVRRRGGST
ncbi:hypothetical protein PG985_013202 [Apiospora marii]|uniref:uncharacterized protein n=1 Tax=Apiospora marii TaxID=335849 RepID=UPI00312DF8EF